MMAKILEHFQREGLVKTLRWGGGRLLERLVWLRKSYVFTKELTQEPLYIKAKRELTFKVAAREDWETLANCLHPWKNYRSLFAERIERGATCMIGFVGPQAVGYIWWTSYPERDPVLGFTITPADEETYGYDLYVIPEYRCYLVGYELLSLWLKNAYQAGKKRAIGVVVKWNKPMLMTLKLVFGFTKKKEMLSLEFFKKRGILIWSANQAP